MDGAHQALRWSLGALAAGLVLAVLLTLLHRDLLDEAAQEIQLRQVEGSVQALQQQLSAAQLLLRSVQGVFLASDHVTAEEFERIYDNISPRELFPSLMAVAYSPLQALPGEAGRYPTQMVAPQAGNEAVLGLDAATQPDNLAAILRSRDTDEPVASAPFPLVQGGLQGVVLRLPVFSPGPIPTDAEERRRREAGSVAMSFDVALLIRHALEAEAGPAFQVRVSDLGRPEAGQVPPQTLLVLGDAEIATPASHTRQLLFGERRWQVEVWPHPEHWPAPVWPWVTLAATVLASVLLALLVWSLLGTRTRALGLAARLSQQYRDSEARFRVLSDLLPALVILVRATDLVPVYVNQAATRRLGSGLLVDRDPLGIAAAGTVLGDMLREVAAGASAVEGQPLELHGEESSFWASVSASRIEFDGQPHVLVLASDISELRELNERLGYQASHDALTDMFNRREFERRLDRALAAASRSEATSALLYIDLDQFKLINDTCGHYAGDQLLAELARVLKDSVASGDVLARLGGDEFGILLQRAGAEEAVAVAQRVRDRVEGFVFCWDQRNFMISASIGVVVIDRAGLSLREVLSQADRACYMAKERGRNRVHLFTEEDTETARRHTEMEWVARVREALKGDRMTLDYQEIEPIKPNRRGDGVHVELLVRMRDETGQLVQPGAFIPAAERFGLMPLVDRWVVETAIANFHRLHPAGNQIELCAINLSGLTVEDDGFADFVLDLLARHPVPPHKLCFEITETAAVNNMTRVIAFMERLRAVGCRFALDDFGAGAASFGYLKNLPIDILKIDGSFIRSLETDPVSYSIVRAVTDIGHQIGLEVIAEWVANERSRELLRGLGVDYVQGFGIHRPEPVPLFQSAG